MRRIYWAVLVGLSCFAQKLPPLKSVPVFERLTVIAVDRQGETLTASARTHIPYSKRSVGFQFSVEPAVADRPEHFRYRLNPILTAWTETDQRSVWFPSLPSGKYSFEIQYADPSSSNWRGGKSVDFEVLAPWWLHPYSILLLLISALLLIREVFRIRVIHLLKRQHELENAVRMRTSELEAERAELLAAREELTARATRDGLTGLWNRSAIFDILDRELDRAKRGEKPVAVILADLDHFKHVNDTYGHLTGDAVLVESARRLTCDLRAYDATGRYGGEELLIVLSNCDEDSAVARAEDLRIRLRGEPITFQGEQIWITCSFGVALSRSQSTSGELLRQADDALYRAKRAGRDRVVSAWTMTPDDSVAASVRRS